jgi:transcription elongation factor GreA
MSEAEIILDQESKIYLTAEGYSALKAELAKLTGETRAEIAERIRESQQHGEFSEDNSELDQVKTEQAFVENRIGELRSILSHAAELDPESIPTDHVGLGSVVKIEDLSYGDTFEVRVVSSVEADPDKDFLSSESPMGTALYGHVEGDTINFESPDGMKKVKIHRISR